MNLLPTGLEFLRHIHALAADLPDPATTLAAELGYTSRTVGSWIATARNWATVDEETADRVASYTIEQLAIISRAMNKSRDPEAVRTTLIDATSRGLTCDQLKIKADEAVQENQPKKPRTALTFSTRADGTGTKFAQLALPSLQMNKLQALVRKHWPTGKEAKHMTESLRNGIGFLNLLASTSVDGGDPWDITLTPAFPIALPGSKYVGDGKFITTSGDILTGVDIANATLSEYGYVTIYDGDGNIGCCYLLKQERFATKQLRAALAIDQIYCAHEQCTTLAAFSQGHHVWPHKAGGETTSDNIVLACKPHNLANDDDRYIDGTEKNGWTGRDEHGKAGSKRPHEEEFHYNTTPGVERSGRAIIEAELGL